MAKSPSRDYVEVAYLEARQQSDYSTHGTSEILEELRNEAGQRGCDGLIMQGDSDTVVGSSNNGTGSVSTLKGYKATCIVYK